MGLFSFVDNRGYKRRKGSNRLIHRIRAEKKLGRPLRKGEVVHHKNRNKRDNSLGNLHVFKDHKSHDRAHKWDAFRFGKKASYKGFK